MLEMSVNLVNKITDENAPKSQHEMKFHPTIF